MANKYEEEEENYLLFEPQKETLKGCSRWFCVQLTWDIYQDIL